MDAVVAGVGKGKYKFLDVGFFLHHGDAVSTSLWVREMGYVPTHWEDAGRLPPSYGQHI